MKHLPLSIRTNTGVVYSARPFDEWVIRLDLHLTDLTDRVRLGPLRVVVSSLLEFLFVFVYTVRVIPVVLRMRKREEFDFERAWDYFQLQCDHYRAHPLAVILIWEFALEEDRPFDYTHQVCRSVAQLREHPERGQHSDWGIDDFGNVVPKVEG